jgi:type IV fimbrial biogenesis protein FimT
MGAARTMSARNTGFTILELMITLTVAGILLAMAAPAMGNFLKDNRLSTQANDLVSALTVARSEAIKRRTDIELAPKGGSWNNGWVVRDVAGVLGTLRTYDMAPGIQETGGALPASIVFRASGARAVLAPVVAKLCDDRGKGRRVEIRGLGTADVCWINYPGRPEECANDNNCN